jgi:prolipoprotein diacylglyceryltransferase
LYWMSRRPHREGSLFRVFLAAYLGFRFCVDFWKPQPVVGGLNWIQWGCVAGLVMLTSGAIGRMLAARRREVIVDA